MRNIITPAILPVKGFLRGILYDVNSSDYHFVPNDLIDIFCTQSAFCFSDLIENYFDAEKEIIIEYYNFLKEKQLLIDLGKEENIQSINYKYESPVLISNMIIDIKNDMLLSSGIIDSIIKEMDNFFCQGLLIRCYMEEYDNDLINKLLMKFNESTIRSLYLCLNYSKKLDNNILGNIYDKFPRVVQIKLYNCPETLNIDKFPIIKIHPNYLEFNTNILSEKNCGFIIPQFFSINMQMITESLHFNTCLNNKICIDKDGYIKNCPSMNKHYGHISETSLEKVINTPGFKECWNIKKDDIDVCRDCEFRHICTDCRAFIKDENNLYSQPSKCSYNPYIAKWKGQEGWISVEQWRLENSG